MREIKYRAWFDIMKEMVVHENLVLQYDAGEGFTMAFDKSNYVDDENIFGTLNFTLMQYTGLKDKNSKEIYEFDVIDVKDEGFPFVKNWIGIVKFIEGSYLIENLEGTDGEYLFDELRDIEVIGNIYENDDLLDLAQSAIETNESPSP